MHGRGLFSESTYQSIQANCPDLSNPSAQCQNILTQMSYEVGNINVYNTFEPCISDPPLPEGARHHKAPLPQYLRDLQSNNSTGPVAGPVECIDSRYLYDYLNNPTVQQAIHVKAPQSGPWMICTGQLNYSPVWPSLCISPQSIELQNRYYQYSTV